MTNQEYVRTLVINQLGDSPSYNQVLQWLADNYDRLQDILSYVQTINVFEARGVWLDLIGAIVGQSRTIENAFPYSYFGYFGQTAVTGYGQARYRKPGDPIAASSILADTEYRQLILARVSRNYGDVSEPGVVEALQILTGIDNITIAREAGGGEFTVFIGPGLSVNTAAILGAVDIIPRAAGVNVKIVSADFPDMTFGNVA